MPKIKLLLVSLLLSAITSAQTTSSKQAIVQQTIQKLFDALSNIDTISLKLYCTSDVKFYEYGQIWTIDTLIQKVMVMSKVANFKRINSFEFVNTTISKKSAWVTYYLQSTITRNNKQETVNWMETVVLLKVKNQWKINTLHSTRLVKN